SSSLADGPPFEDIPLRTDLADPSMFDAEARLLLEARPHIEALRRLVNDNPSTRRLLDRAPKGAKFLSLAIEKLGSVPCSEAWIHCPRCVGKGRKKELMEHECGTCAGAGYQFE